MKMPRFSFALFCPMYSLIHFGRKLNSTCCSSASLVFPETMRSSVMECFLPRWVAEIFYHSLQSRLKAARPRISDRGPFGRYLLFNSLSYPFIPEVRKVQCLNLRDKAALVI